VGRTRRAACPQRRGVQPTPTPTTKPEPEPNTEPNPEPNPEPKPNPNPYPYPKPNPTLNPSPDANQARRTACTTCSRSWSSPPSVWPQQGRKAPETCPGCFRGCPLGRRGTPHSAWPQQGQMPKLAGMPTHHSRNLPLFSGAAFWAGEERPCRVGADERLLCGVRCGACPQLPAPAPSGQGIPATPSRVRSPVWAGPSAS